MKFQTLVNINNPEVFGMIETYLEDSHTIVELYDCDTPILFKELNIEKLRSFINVGELDRYKIINVEI